VSLLHFELLFEDLIFDLNLRGEGLETLLETLNLLECLHFEDAGRSNLSSMTAEVSLNSDTTILSAVNLF